VIPLDRKAEAALAESERTGRPLVFTGDQCTSFVQVDVDPDVDLDKSHVELTPWAAAARLAAQLDRGEIDYETAEQLADDLAFALERI
jgi:hypothetical protein